jgi:hypothetical protein
MEILFFIPIFRFPFALKMYETTNMYNSSSDTDWMLCNKKRRKYPLTSDVLNDTTKTVQVLSDCHNQELTYNIVFHKRENHP